MKRRQLHAMAPAALLLIVAVLYANALSNPYLIDDHDVIENHPDVIEAKGLRRLWTHDYWAGRAADKNLYRPITILTYHLGMRLWGPRPAAFRTVNILLLALGGILTACWLKSYVRYHLAWAAALLFAAHPAHTELINHIVGHADLLELNGILAFLIIQRRATRDGSWSPLQVIGATAAALVALGAKETGLLLVPLAAIQAWVDQRPDLVSAGAPKPPQDGIGLRISTAMIVLIPVGLYLTARVTVVGTGVSYPAGHGDLTTNPLRGLEIGQRLPAALAIARHMPVLCYGRTPASTTSRRNCPAGAMPRRSSA